LEQESKTKAALRKELQEKDDALSEKEELLKQAESNLKILQAQFDANFTFDPTP